MKKSSSVYVFVILMFSLSSVCMAQDSAPEEVMPDNTGNEQVLAEQSNDTRVMMDNEGVIIILGGEATAPESENDTDVSISEEITDLDDGYIDNDTLYDDELKALEDLGFEALLESMPDQYVPVIAEEENDTIESLTRKKSKLQLEVAVAPADIILLANGESVEGVIRTSTDEIVSIETETGLSVYRLEEIDYIDEMDEKSRFYLLHKLEELHEINRKLVRIKLEREKQKLEQAQQKQEYVDIVVGMESGDLFALSTERLEKIIKEFAQFSPEYWRYYHRRPDAMKALLQLKRLKRYAHPEVGSIIDLYIRAFEAKVQELREGEESLVRSQYKNSYEQNFRQAERRRITALNPEQ
ncbi:MAG: hypothetical protein AB1454_00795 [Candidatus Auribacterota bacterium]